MPERGPSGATISRGPSVGGERGLSSVISGGPRVSITRSVGVTRVPTLERGLATPLRSLSGNSGERPAPLFNRSRLTNISVDLPRPLATTGREFIRGLGEFNATALPQTDVNRLRRQSDPVILPGRGTSGPEIRANTVSIVPFRNNRAFDTGRNIEAQKVSEIGNRPPLRVENTPPINPEHVLSPDVRKTEPVDASRNIPERKQRTTRSIRRIQEQLRLQTIRRSRQTAGLTETSPEKTGVLAFQDRFAATQEIQNAGAQAKNKLIGKLLKREGNQEVSGDNQKVAKEVKEKSISVTLKQRLINSKHAFSLAAARVRSGVAVDLDELPGRKKEEIKSLDQVTITKNPAVQDAVQPDHRVAEALDIVASLDTQPITEPARQPLVQPLGGGVLSDIKPDTAVQAAIDTITTVAAVHPQPNAQIVEQKSTASDVLPQQKSAAQPENNSGPKNSQREEPKSNKGNYIISKPTQTQRVYAGKEGIWLSFTGNEREKIQAEAILERIKKPTAQTTSPVLIALGAGQAESGIADPTDLAWREEFAKAGELTKSEANGILAKAIESNQAIARGPGNPMASKDQVEAVLGNVPHEDEMANLPS